MKENKEFLYIGHYYDTNGNYILKIGTTNDLQRRKKEHTRNYRKNKLYKLADSAEFAYDWYLPLSKYNTLRYESRTKEVWKKENIGTFLRNDRFICAEKPTLVEVKIRKIYQISL